MNYLSAASSKNSHRKASLSHIASKNIPIQSNGRKSGMFGNHTVPLFIFITVMYMVPCILDQGMSSFLHLHRFQRYREPRSRSEQTLPYPWNLFYCLFCQVSCNGLNMTSLPQLPLETVTLDLSGNQIKKILARVFPHLSRLKSLWLDNNKISHLELFAFRGLHDLDVFSIRNNKLLEHLIRFSLAGLRNVRNLLLTDNSVGIEY